jgi:hypothetical protein
VIYKRNNHGHEEIHSGSMQMYIIAMNGYTMELCLKIKSEDIWSQGSEQTDPLQVPMYVRVVQSI